MTRIPPTILVQSTGLADAWGQLVRLCIRDGLEIETEYGNTSKDICAVTEIVQPFLEPMLHPQFPTKELHLGVYIKQWERDYDWKKQGFEYNYMDRLIKYPMANISETDYYHKSDKYYIDQISEIKTNLPKRVSRRQQAITWIPDRDLFVKEDQPCLQRLWFRNLGNNNVEMHCMWRSRDLFGAWNSNMIGLLTMVKKEILEPNNLKLIKVVDFCNSLHIYKEDWESAAKIERININPQIKGRIL